MCLEVEPAAYAALAANEAEKAALINILQVSAVGSFGRLYLGGAEQDILAGSRAAVEAIENIAGREGIAWDGMSEGTERLGRWRPENVWRH